MRVRAAHATRRFSRWFFEPFFFVLPGVLFLATLVAIFGALILVFLALLIALATLLAARAGRKAVPQEIPKLP